MAAYLKNTIYIVLSTLFGMGLGMLFKNQTATVGVILLWFAAVDPALSLLLPSAGQYTLASLGISISGGGTGGQGPYQQILSPVVAMLVYLTYATVPLIVGVMRFRKSDIS